MNYLGIDKWNTDKSLHHGVLSRHKYIKKVGTGPNARYFYSQDEYRHFLLNTSSPKEHAKNMKQQSVELGTLRAFGKKHIDEKANNIKKFGQKVKDGFFKVGPYHSLSSTQRGYSTLHKSALDSSLERKYKISDAKRRFKRSNSVHSHFGNKGSSTLRASAKNKKNSRKSEHIVKTGMRVLKASFGLHLGGALFNAGRNKMKKDSKKYRRLEKRK